MRVQSKVGLVDPALEMSAFLLEHYLQLCVLIRERDKKHPLASARDKWLRSPFILNKTHCEE